MVQVTLTNGSPGCRALMINEFFLAFPSDRPLTLLDFEITDANGKRVARVEGHGVTRRPYVPADLMTLNCGASYGWYVALGRAEWQYSLGTGRYRLRARIENRVHAFFEGQPQELKRILDATGLERDEALQLLRDFSVVSDEVSFEAGVK